MQRLTKEQAAIIGVYTGVLVGDFSDMHEYIEKIMKRPVFTHELADKLLVAEIKKAAKPDLMNIINLN